MKFVSRFLAVSTVAVLLASAATGQDELDALKLRYDVGRAELVKPLRDLQESYQSQLEKLREKVRAAGSLEKTKIVDVEIKEFRTGEAPPAGNDFPELRRLQRIYGNEARTRHATAMRDLPPLVRAYKERLTALQKKLTRENQLEQAQKVSDVLAKVDEGLGIKVPTLLADRVPTTPAEIQVSGPTWAFQTGGRQFTNRLFVWGEVPESYQGWRMTMRAGGSETDTQFKVKTAGVVYAVIGPTFEKDFKDDGWKTVEKLWGGPEGKQDYLVIEKALEVGEHKVSGKGWFTTRLLVPAPPK